MTKNAGPFLERYIKLCEKPVKLEHKRKREEIDDILDNWEGMTKVSNEDFESSLNFETESELLAAIENKSKESIKKKDHYIFLELNIYMKSQLKLLYQIQLQNSNEHTQLKLKLTEAEEKLNEINKCIQVFNKGITRSDSIYSKLMNRIDIKPRSLDDFDEDSFLEKISMINEE